MTKKYLIIAVVAIAAIGLLYLIFSKPFEYNVLDEISEQSEAGNVLFLFVDVNDLDSNAILKASKKLLKERVIDLYKDIEIPNDIHHHHEEMGQHLLIAYFYRQGDTAAVPEAMKNVLKTKFPRNEIVKYQLNYISEGFMYTGLYSPFEKKVRIDSLSPKTMLFVPKEGILAKDIMKDLPKEEAEEEIIEGQQ